MIGLDGIAVINVVVRLISLKGGLLSDVQVNPVEADISGNKKLQTRITHNDGGSWKPLNPPPKDSLGQTYDCQSTVGVSIAHNLSLVIGRSLYPVLLPADSWVHRAPRRQGHIQQPICRRCE